ncbi:UV-endonuclease UvdE-domain-containing protein [Dunaliella salina]|uniref:UV-endonuclease UvdE-domain-containing protein n=1 Tax=Dunaliella salina TaxID=3046 RepID=A0ABQ7H970_DUNSA|nr:UV-endonuclease UvdE-domain-containing protein [Dunaliella salina]|eukprot:KAF5843403.1 UV-endonuclease UvdE-domain-containing protein [Dunaliella salina]
MRCVLSKVCDTTSFWAHSLRHGFRIRSSCVQSTRQAGQLVNKGQRGSPRVAPVQRGIEEKEEDEDWRATRALLWMPPPPVDAPTQKTTAAGRRVRKSNGGAEALQQAEEVHTPAKKPSPLRKPKAGTRKRAHDDAMKAMRTQEEGNSKEAIDGTSRKGGKASELAPAAAAAAAAAAAVVQPQPQKRPKPRATKASLRAEVLEALHAEGELAPEFHLYEAYPHTREFNAFRTRSPALTPAPSARHTMQPMMPLVGLPDCQQQLQQAAQSVPLPQPSCKTGSSLAQWTSTGYWSQEQESLNSGRQWTHLQARLQRGPHSSVLTYSASDVQSTSQQSVSKLAVYQPNMPQQQQQQQQQREAVSVEQSRAHAKANTPAAVDIDTEVESEEVASVYPDPTALEQLEVQARSAASAAPETVALALEDAPPAQQPLSLAAGLPEVEDEDAAFNAPLRTAPWPTVVPNLGYACLCETLREYDVFSSRNCVKATFQSKGLPAVSALALANARDLLPLIRWNGRHGIQFFRLSSEIFPWMTKYRAEELPDFPAIRQALFAAGEAARALGQRLTFHPSEFCKIAGAEDREDYTNESISQLESHSYVFDLMGYEPSAWNKINIHVGGTYGNKDATLRRFAKVVNERLSNRCKARLTVENDDRAAMYSVRDLLKLHDMCGIPIVFDFHHHKFCTGGMSEEEAFLAAIATWPAGVRPVCHWSEARDDRHPTSHSTYVLGPIFLHGKEHEVDVMIESKGKELSLLRYREMACRAAAARVAKGT